jgi:hypothetical protein
LLYFLKFDKIILLFSILPNQIVIFGIFGEDKVNYENRFVFWFV